MFKKKIISEGLLLGILVYAVFISFLYFRMKNAENTLSDYEKRLCPSSFDCRQIIRAEILDYGSSEISFTNHGPQGIPLESGTFEEYIFKMSIENSEAETIIVSPNTPSDISGFDVENIYVPSKSDVNILNGSIFNEKDAYVEIWRGNVTFILITSNANNGTQLNENQSSQVTSITSPNSLIYDSVLPTENHPVILAESAKNNFIGWTGGVVLMVVSVTVVGASVSGFFYGMDWIIRKWRKDDKSD